MKKGLIMCLLLVMLFIFSGCGGNEDSKKSNENNGSNKNGNDVILNNKKEAYNKNNDTLSSAIIKDIGGIKTYTVYEGSKGLEHDELEDSNIYEIRLLLTEDNNYYMDHGSFAGNVSVGTYEVDDNKLILNQTKYQGSDVCYYYQNKEFRLSYTKKNDGDNQKIVDFDTITINLKDIEGFIDKELVLMEGVKTYLDNLYYSEDFFGVYCGIK